MTPIPERITFSLVKPYVALMLAGALWLSGCGDAEEAGRQAGAAGNTRIAADERGGGEPRRTTDRCPLTAREVGEVLGQEMALDQASCSFFPEDDTAIQPNASFNVQLPGSCDEEGLSAMEYEQPIGGIGDAAYVRRGMADGTWLLVCAGDAPFEIRVDSESGDDAAQAAAEELARRVLASR